MKIGDKAVLNGVITGISKEPDEPLSVSVRLTGWPTSMTLTVPVQSIAFTEPREELQERLDEAFDGGTHPPGWSVAAEPRLIRDTLKNALAYRQRECERLGNSRRMRGTTYAAALRKEAEYSAELLELISRTDDGLLLRWLAEEATRG